MTVKRLALLGAITLALAAPANAEVGGFAPGRCQQFSFRSDVRTWCLKTAYGKGQGTTPHSFAAVTGTGLSYNESNDFPCRSELRGAAPVLTYFAVWPDHTAHAVIHFTGDWLSGRAYDPETGQCGAPYRTFRSRPWDLDVWWDAIPDSPFDLVCFGVGISSCNDVFQVDSPTVLKSDVRRWPVP
jgi:hypothetical protein